jgi:hypothetical protein
VVSAGGRARTSWRSSTSLLGNLLGIGKGVAQSDDEAARWFRLAAAQGDAEGLFILGACHENGEGPQDDDEALRCYKRAAAKGHAGAAAAVKRLETWLANYAEEVD